MPENRCSCPNQMFFLARILDATVAPKVAPIAKLSADREWYPTDILHFRTIASRPTISHRECAMTTSNTIGAVRFGVSRGGYRVLPGFHAAWLGERKISLQRFLLVLQRYGSDMAPK